MKILETAIKPISKSFLNYLHLATWIDQRVASLISGKSVYVYSSVEQFWKDIAQENLPVGSRIRFKEAFITEWVPRIPGGPWIENLKDIKLNELRDGYRIASSGILRSTVKPLGVIRLPFGKDKTSFAALSLTTIDSWYCDLGIPLLVSESVYNSFSSKRVKNNSVEGDIEGILCFDTHPQMNAELFKSLGSEISKDYLDSIFTPSSMPYVYLSIVSPLDVKLRSHNSHPLGFLWCINREIRDKEVIFHESKNYTEINNVDPYSIYAFNMISTDLSDMLAVESCVKSFSEGGFQFVDGSVYPVPSRTIGNIGVDVLTEFDARRRYFKNSVPLMAEIYKDISALNLIKRILMDFQHGITDKKEIGEGMRDVHK